MPLHRALNSLSSRCFLLFPLFLPPSFLGGPLLLLQRLCLPGRGRPPRVAAQATGLRALAYQRVERARPRRSGERRRASAVE